MILRNLNPNIKFVQPWIKSHSQSLKLVKITMRISMKSIDLCRSFKKANMSKPTHKTAFKPVLRIALTALALGASFCAFGQFIPYGQSSQPAQQYSQPNAFSGYSPDGVLYMGGQKIGNPHQILHDAEVPAFMTITANRYTYTNDPAHPNYGQGTLAQMETATTVNTPANVLLNRLYLTANNPYPVVPTGTHNNFQTYQGALANAQTAGYKAITADDGKAYAVKTLTAANTQAQNILVRELPNTSQFRAAADPAGGAVGVRVTQNGDAVALANYMSTVTPYNFAAQPNFGVYGSIGSNVNQYGSQANNAWAGAQIGQNGSNSANGDCWFPAPCASSPNGIGVSFDRGFSYKNQFYIFNGADEAQRISMQKDIEGIMNTQKGQELSDTLNQRNILYFLPQPYYIQVIKEQDAYTLGANVDTTYINPNFKPQFETATGFEAATTQRVLAHEFGHSVGGVADFKRGDRDEPKNVRVWENPIMKELGESERITYFYHNDVYNPLSKDISINPQTGAITLINYSIGENTSTSTESNSVSTSESTSSSDSTSTSSGGGGN
jgi:hypothetical protein